MTTLKMLQNKKIAIIGGGPGGLTLARLLQLKGADVQVYERDLNRQARVQGATLDLHHDSGLRAIREANLMDAFMASYRPGADHTRVTNQQGHILYEDDFASEEQSGEAFRPEIDRGPLRNILLDSLKPDTVVWNSRFQSLTPQGQGWIITFDNGATAYADLVIGADGANSKLRPYVTPLQPIYSGVTVIEGGVYNAAGACPQISELLAGGKIFALDNGKTLIVSTKGDGSLAFYTGAKTPATWVAQSGVNFADRSQIRTWFNQQFTGWAPLWNELIDNAELPLTPRPQYYMPLDQTWPAQPNLTLIGDAAHLMPPYAGEGVNMAMLDAVELAQHLFDPQHPDTQTAIAAYEHQMRTRASETARQTLENTDALHSQNAINFLIEVIGGPQE